MEPRQPQHRPPLRRYPDNSNVPPHQPRRPIHVQSNPATPQSAQSQAPHNQPSHQVTSNLTNSIHQTSHNAHHNADAPSQSTTSHNIVNWLKKVVRKLKRLVGHFFRKIRKLLQPIWKRARKLPWKIITSVFAVILFVLAMIFHFYIASTSRIVGTFESNLTTAQELEEEIRKTSSAISKIPPYATDTSSAQEALNNLETTASNNAISLPPKFVASYAFRGYNDAADTIDVLYRYENASDSIAIIARESATLLDITSQLFTKKIDVNTQEYIDFTRQSIIQIEKIDTDNQELSAATILRIYRQILESAEQYQISEDLNNFTFQTSNVSSELYKEIYATWNTPMDQVLTGISAQRSSLESIINTIE